MSKFKILEDIILRTYSSHILLIKIVDQTNYVNFDRHDFIATNMMSIKLILELFWLMNQNSNIDWSAQTIRWRFFDESNDENWIKNLENNTVNSVENFSFFSRISCNDVDLSIINYDEFKRIEQKKQTQTFVLKYSSVESKFNFFVVKTIDDEIAMQILSFCYHEFRDVFNKTISKILLKHVSHDHAIDSEKNMFFFESIYNLFMFELKILREYLNKNLINDFIVLFSFSIEFFIFLLKRRTTHFVYV